MSDLVWRTMAPIHTLRLTMHLKIAHQAMIANWSGHFQLRWTRLKGTQPGSRISVPGRIVRVVTCHRAQRNRLPYFTFDLVLDAFECSYLGKVGPRAKAIDMYFVERPSF